MLFKVIFFVLFSNVKSSRVVDIASQSGIHISDYCPNSNVCPEGTHVMCMYYNPQKVIGPKCRNARNITMTAELANKLLDVSNAIRSKIARGNERGKDNLPLPRGYGIFRLKWDAELATFAQVLVNQCMLRHDQCRATKRFPNPGQVASVVRFSVPDWIPKNNLGNYTDKGFNTAKVLYAAAQSLKSWYRQKGHVSARILNDYPDWEKIAPNQLGRLYMDMIYGPATHMGCGVSAYTEYAFYPDRQPLYYNSIFFVCNYSARPTAGGAVYNTLPPGDPNAMNPCGCPAGSVDDDDCLCHEEVKEPFQPTNLPEERTCPPGMQCDPTVVLLPIFTVEDAPIEKLVTDSRKYSNGSEGNVMDITDSLEIFNKDLTEFKHTYRTKIKIPDDTTNTNSRRNMQPHWKQSMPKTKQTIKIRHFGPKQNEIINHNDKGTRKELSHLTRSSFFAKTPRFKLPGANVLSSIANKRNNLGVKKQLVDKYLHRKENVVVPDSNELKSKEMEKHTGVFPHTIQNPLIHNMEQNKGQEDKAELGLDTVEHLISDNEYLDNDLNSQSKNVKNLGVKSVTEESDNKLMALLDTLEQEVKHIELRDDEKQIFDAKIKKIYVRVVGKHVDNILEHNMKNENLGFHDIMEGHKALHNEMVINHDQTFDDTLNAENVQEIDKTNTRTNVYNERQEEAYNEDHLRQDFATEQPHIMEYASNSRKFGKNDRNVKSTIKNNYKMDNVNKSYRRRNMDNENQSNHNEIHFAERLNHHIIRNNNKQYDRKSQRRDLLNKYSLRKNAGNTKIRSNAEYKRTRPSYDSNEFQSEDPLSADRRKYYQDKLENIQKNLKNVRHSSRKKDSSSQHLRAMLPPRSVNLMESLYMPGRSRILHGY